MTAVSAVAQDVIGASGFRGLTGALFVLLCGCAHETLIVKTSPTSELPGIPFYLKKGVCNKESVWLEPQYTVALAISVDGQSAATRSMVVTRRGYEDAMTQSLLKRG